jgi:hypothetical protein
MRKREAIAAYRSQITNLTGEAGWAGCAEVFAAVPKDRGDLFRGRRAEVLNALQEISSESRRSVKLSY